MSKARKSVKTLVLTGYGINCEEEVAECFKQVGSDSEILHINELIRESDKIDRYDILALPGGFSFGDHIACGKNFSNKIKFNIFKEFSAFVRSGRPVIGICNGYQVLVKLGVVPDLSGNLSGNFMPEFTFTHNTSHGEAGGGHSRFEDRWVRLLRNEKNFSFWLNDLMELELPVRHGEGRLVCPNPSMVTTLKEQGQIALYYADEKFSPASTYPDNPNGSIASIAALTNQAGNVLGIMPHPEAYSLRAHYPNFVGQEDSVRRAMQKQLTANPLFSKEANDRVKSEKWGVGMWFFYNAVKHVGG